jgi:hypothetical protein
MCFLHPHSTDFPHQSFQSVFVISIGNAVPDGSVLNIADVHTISSAHTIFTFSIAAMPVPDGQTLPPLPRPLFLLIIII